MLYMFYLKVLADRYERLFSHIQPTRHRVFIGFNGNIDVILNGMYKG